MTLDSLAQFIVTGIVNGAIYALVGLGFVVVARVTGVINFAQGEFAMLGALGALGLHAVGLPLPLALLGSVLLVTLLAGLLYRLAIQPARDASVAMLIIITVGWAVILQGAARVVWGSDPLSLPPLFPGAPLQVLGATVLPQGVWVLVGTALLVALVYLLFQRTVLGMALRANAANPFAAQVVGIDSRRMALASFLLAGAIGAAGGGMLAPLSFASWNMGVLLGLKGFTAAILGGMGILGVVVGGLVLGLAESLAGGLISSAYRDAIAFLLLILVLIVRPVGLGGIAAHADGDAITASFGPPRAASGWLARNAPFLLAAALLLALPLVVTGSRVNLLVLVAVYGLAALGLTLLLGYAGQISLGHTVFMGIGAYASAILTLKSGWSPLLALVAGAALAGLVAFALGRPIFRLRGNNLAMATLGLTIIFGVLATQAIPLTGGSSGLPSVPPFGLGPLVVRGLVPVYYLAAGLLLLALLFSLNVVASRFGRAMRAIHVSESAAAACGVHVPNLKTLVLVLSAVLASLAGSLYAHYITIVSPQPFGFGFMVALLTMVVVGGMTSPWGAPLGAAVVVLIPELIRWLAPNASRGETAVYEQIVYGLVLVLTAIFLPDGLAAGVSRLAGWVGARVGQWRGAATGEARTAAAASAALSVQLPVAVRPALVIEPGDALTPTLSQRERAYEATNSPANGADDSAAPLLQVEGLAVRFGGLQAVDGVSLAVPAGQIVALIGPNGAGKTTMFNAIAGALRPSGGRVWLDGAEISGLQAAAVARRGLARTFQDVRTFSTMSVLENVMLGRCRQERATLVEAGLRAPRFRREEAQAVAEARDWLAYVGLAALADRPAASLPLAQQRMLALARALALRPRILLLDEPAAGLSEPERAELVAMLRRLRAEALTVLLVEHDMGLVMGLVDGVIVLDRGRKIADGAPEQVQRDAAVIAAYLGAPVEAAAAPPRPALSGEPA